MALSIGQKAPDFTLYSSDKREVSLSSFEGKNVILLFFPFAFSSVCTAELCEMRDNLSLYNHLNAEVVAISVDSIYTLKKFKDDENLTFTLLSDFNKEVSRLYESIYEHFPSFNLQGVSKRAAFVVDKEGNLRFAQVNERPQDLPDFNAIRETLKSLG